MDVTPTEFLKQAVKTAEHFGFKHIDQIKKEPAVKNAQKKIEHTATAQNRRIDSLHGMLTAGTYSFCEEKMHDIEGPVLFYSAEQVPRSGEAAFGLHVFNVEKSIAEAILIQTSRSLALDLGYDKHSIRINSLGDRDSIVRYMRELNNYLKKRMGDMPEAARELMKISAIDALHHLIDKGHELAYKSPSPLEYLTDQSRKHFREIIEYLDMTETPYEIDPKLIGHHECYSDALFAIDILDENDAPMSHSPIMIRGGRYNEFVYRNTKKQIPAAGALMVLRDKKAPIRSPQGKNSNPSIYVVQLGFGPKIRSLMLINELRQAGISVHQNLASDSLSSQLRDAEDKGVKYTIIIGQKEFVEGTVILRDMIGRNQENVRVGNLLARLKQVKVTTA